MTTETIRDECAWLPVAGAEPVRAGVEARASQAWRGQLVATMHEGTVIALEEPLSSDLVKAFVPSFRARGNAAADVFMDRLGRVIAGRGLSQKIYAEMLWVFWRLPFAWWSAAIQPPPLRVAAFRSLKPDDQHARRFMRATGETVAILKSKS